MSPITIIRFPEKGLWWDEQDSNLSEHDGQHINCKSTKSIVIYKLYDNHDWRATFGTQLKEANLSSAQIADLLGHADTRMVETIYAITRHEGIMKHQNLLNALNPYGRGPSITPEGPSTPEYIRVLENAVVPSWSQRAKNG